MVNASIVGENILREKAGNLFMLFGYSFQQSVFGFGFVHQNLLANWSWAFINLTHLLTKAALDIRCTPFFTSPTSEELNWFAMAQNVLSGQFLAENNYIFHEL